MSRAAVKSIQRDLKALPDNSARIMSVPLHNENVRLQNACDAIATKWRQFGLNETEARAEAEKFRSRFEQTELDAVLARVADAMVSA